MGALQLDLEHEGSQRGKRGYWASDELLAVEVDGLGSEQD